MAFKRVGINPSDRQMMEVLREILEEIKRTNELISQQGRIRPG